jgi:hypothetical protein
MKAGKHISINMCAETFNLPVRGERVDKCSERPPRDSMQASHNDLRVRSNMPGQLQNY